MAAPIEADSGDDLVDALGSTEENGVAQSSEPQSCFGNRFDRLSRRSAAPGAACPFVGQVRRGADVAESSRLPLRRNRQANAARYDFLLVIDFEATCDEGEHDWPHEIIEFPCVAVSTRTCRVVAEFHSFVRPHRQPQLTTFCTNLTGIHQEDVDTAPALQDVVVRFEQWFLEHFAESRCIVATDGPWDMRDFMFKHSVVRDGVRFPPIFYRWLNLRKAYADFFHIKPIGIGQMLTRLGMDFAGRPHSGIDDARNIARIAIALMQRGCRFTNVSSIDSHAPGHQDYAALAREIESGEIP